MTNLDIKMLGLVKDIYVPRQETTHPKRALPESVMWGIIDPLIHECAVQPETPPVRVGLYSVGLTTSSMGMAHLVLGMRFAPAPLMMLVEQNKTLTFAQVRAVVESPEYPHSEFGTFFFVHTPELKSVVSILRVHTSYVPRKSLDALLFNPVQGPKDGWPKARVGIPI